MRLLTTPAFFSTLLFYTSVYTRVRIALGDWIRLIKPELNSIMQHSGTWRKPFPPAGWICGQIPTIVTHGMRGRVLYVPFFFNSLVDSSFFYTREKIDCYFLSSANYSMKIYCLCFIVCYFFSEREAIRMAFVECKN